MPLLKCPLFPFQGRAGEQPQAGGDPGRGALPAWEGRRGDVPHTSGPFWPMLSSNSHPIMEEQCILASSAAQSLSTGYTHGTSEISSPSLLSRQRWQPALGL